MVAFKLILALASIVAAAPLEKRDSAKTVAGIAAVTQKTVALNDALKTYQGGIFTALPVQNAASALQTTLDATVADLAKEPPQYTMDDTVKILTAVQALDGSVKDSTDLVVQKAASYGALKSTVSSTMQNLKTSSDKLSEGLTSRTPEAQKAAAAQVKSQIDGYFTKAITALA